MNVKRVRKPRQFDHAYPWAQAHEPYLGHSNLNVSDNVLYQVWCQCKSGRCLDAILKFSQEALKSSLADHGAPQGLERIVR